MKNIDGKEMLSRKAIKEIKEKIWRIYFI